MSETPEVIPDRAAGPSRRTVATAAAWSLPVIAVAAATPAAVASPEGDGPTALVLTGYDSNLLDLDLISNPVVGALVGSTVPTVLRITNGDGSYSGAITGTITITPNARLLASIGGTPKGIQVAGLGLSTLSGQDVYDGDSGLLGLAPQAYSTSVSFSYSGAALTSGQQLNLPIAFSYTDQGGGLLSLGLFPSFTVTVTLTSTTPTRTTTGSISGLIDLDIISY